MSYTIRYTIDFGEAAAGITVNGQLYDGSGVASGAAISAGFVEMRDGLFWYALTVADGFAGSIAFYDTADETNRAAAVIAPMETEYLDAKVSTLGDAIGALGASSSITAPSIFSGSTFAPARGDTWRAPTVTIAGFVLTSYDALAFAVKGSTGDTDEQSILFVRTDDGLTHVNGAAIASPVASTDGVLTATGATTFSLLVHMPATSLVSDGDYKWFLKGFDAGSPDEGYTIATGAFNVLPWGIRAVE